MLSSRLDQDAMGLSHQHLAKTDHFAETAGPREDPGMGRHPDNSTQHLRRHAVARVAIDDLVQPPSAKIMIGGIGSESVNENIDIGKDHRASIRSSRSLDRFRSMPGSVPPDALEIGNRTRSRFRGFDSASTIFRPSSTSEVTVRPSSAAFFLALRSRSSDSLMVVLICQRILPGHQYVNRSRSIASPGDHRSRTNRAKKQLAEASYGRESPLGKAMHGRWIKTPTRDAGSRPASRAQHFPTLRAHRAPPSAAS